MAEYAGADPASTPYAQGTPQTVLRDVVVLPSNNPEAARRLILARGDRRACLSGPFFLPNGQLEQNALTHAFRYQPHQHFQYPDRPGENVVLLFPCDGPGNGAGGPSGGDNEGA